MTAFCFSASAAASAVDSDSSSLESPALGPKSVEVVRTGTILRGRPGDFVGLAAPFDFVGDDCGVCMWEEAGRDAGLPLLTGS